MADKPPLPPAPGMTTKPKQPKPSAVAAQAPTTRPMPPPALKKPPPLAPPRQGVPPLKPPPAHHYRQHQQAPTRKQRHHRGSSCSCRRVCCVATGLVLVFLCLAFAASCLAYLYYHPHPPSFHLQPISLTRFKITNSTAVSAMDVTVRAKLVSWNPNDRVAFEYAGNGAEGRVALADADGDVELGWGPVVLGGQGGGAAGFEHAPRSVAALGFVAAAKGVVVDEAVAGRVRDRYRRRQLAFKVVVDTHVGVRLAGLALRTGMVPVRVFCDGGVMAPRGSSAAGSPMSKCQVYLFRMKWLSLN